MCVPRGSRACDNYMVPNLPAPMTPTVTGFPAASRSSSLACRFTGVALPYAFASQANGNTGAKPKQAAAKAGYWQSARETKVSVRQLGPLLRPER